LPIIDHFGIIAPIYDRAIPLVKAENLINIIKLPVDGYLLDAGGGTGRVGQFLRDYVKDIIIADLSLEMLIQAKKKGGMHVIGSQTELLPFPAESFDRVIMVDAFHHVHDQQQTVQDIWRVLRPGGRVVIEEPNIKKLSVKFIAIAEKLAFMRSHFMNPVRIADLFPPASSRIKLKHDGFNSWIIVDKLPER